MLEALYKYGKNFTGLCKTIVLLLNLVFSSYLIFGQSTDLIQVKGIVVNTKLEPVSFVHILVKNKNSGTVSNETGRFDIFLTKGDTLQFSCVGYKRANIVIPKVTDFKIYHLVAVLTSDTIILPEVTIFPWKNYKAFVHAFLTTKIPDDDIVRAENNFNLLKLQMIVNEDEIPPAQGAAYNLSMLQRNEQLYWKGQTQPMQIFNVFAWAQFFDYLKKGKFKRKKTQ